MFRLSKTFTFEASHQLPHHDGKCARLHGHSWKGRIVCSGTELHESGAKSGMLIDYADISAAIKPLVDGCLDHYHLNESTGLENPTSEELARWIFNKLSGQLSELEAVEIEETCTASCRYEV